MAENRMELFIETLTGTAFELSCSPLETIVSIKAKIQYSEGIPVSQQHLIWKSQELNDDLCLQDYRITDGATLKLVLGMRGGPINTRQVSDTKKLKDLADYVERRSETSGSNGRPFTVLVFHDGDKVHMYTLVEQGECSVSPLSGTISETSSVASIKQVEELDEELIRENEITKEKIAQLQEQIKALNINRSRKVLSTSHVEEQSLQTKQSDKDVDKEFHLPPLQQIDSYGPQGNYSSSYAQNKAKTAEKPYLSRLTSDVGSQSLQAITPDNAEDINFMYEKNKNELEKDFIMKSKNSRPSSPLDCVLNSVSAHMLTLPQVDSPEPITKSCSNFLPYIASNQGNSRIHKKSLLNFSAQNGQILALSMHNSPCLSSVVKYDSYRAKKAHKYLPATSSEALSSRKFLDLDDWIQNRPKTMPEETACKDELERKTSCKNKLFREERGKRRIKRSIKNPLSVNLSPEEKSALLVKAFNNQRTNFYDVPSSVSYKTNYGHSQNDITGTAAFKEFSSSDASLKNSNTVLNEKSTKMSLKVKEENNRPHSGRKLPFIKAKKKSYKRCSLCSKKTGLATSYVCRCGKNFCASHRYAEVHNCSYDYKTEGRRILQLNNPVVAASKLPKI